MNSKTNFTSSVPTLNSDMNIPIAFMPHQTLQASMDNSKSTPSKEIYQDQSQKSITPALEEEMNEGVKNSYCVVILPNASTDAFEPAKTQLN